MTRRLRAVSSVAVLGLLAVAWAVLAGIAAPTAARADSGDVVESYDLRYHVLANGVVDVREQIVYRFGSSGRHGIYRNLVTRESYVDNPTFDQLYEISDITVSSPSGASSQFTQKTLDEGQTQNLQLTIGSASTTITDPTETYVISYSVKGALRHFTDHSELYWDATGAGWDAELANVAATVTVPRGVTQVKCFTGSQRSTTPCDKARIIDAKGEFTQANLGSGEGLTIVNGVHAGAVTNDTPILVKAPSALERAGIPVPGLVGGGVVAVGAVVGTIAFARVGNKDLRFAGLAPATVPSPGSDAPIVKDDVPDSAIPVSFTPPPIPVAAGGLLVDATLDTRDTAATLIDLAVRGGLRIEQDGDTRRAVLVDPSVALAGHEQVLVDGLFPGRRVGDTVDLERGKVGETTMLNAHTAHVAAVRDEVQRQGWYTRMPSASRGRSGGGRGIGAAIGCAFAAVWILVIGGGVVGSIAGAPGLIWVLALPVLTIIVGLVVIGRIRGRGQRSAVGRAMDDQLVGFKKYLSTAEASQLRFEEGQDVYSRYLPWAIAFDLADRWARVCKELADQGRIPSQPGWYSGPSYYSNPWVFAGMASSMSSSFSPPPTPSSGGGGGSSSGFGGGGFSGGGGGGGGGGSW